MTRKDFVALAAILREHRKMVEENDWYRPPSFSHLVEDISRFCKAQNPNFDAARFTSAIYED